MFHSNFYTRKMWLRIDTFALFFFLHWVTCKSLPLAAYSWNHIYQKRPCIIFLSFDWKKIFFSFLQTKNFPSPRKVLNEIPPPLKVPITPTGDKYICIVNIDLLHTYCQSGILTGKVLCAIFILKEYRTIISRTYSSFQVLQLC